MKCKEAVRRILESDHGNIPVLVQIHCRMCSKCMTELTAVRNTERILRDKWPVASSGDLSHSVMARLPLPSAPERKRTSWIPGFSGGVMIVSSLFLVNFSDSFVWMERVMGDEFVIPVNIVLGVCLTCYIGGCIASQSSRLSHYLHHGGKH